MAIWNDAGLLDPKEHSIRTTRVEFLQGDTSSVAATYMLGGAVTHLGVVGLFCARTLTGEIVRFATSLLRER